MSHRHRNRSGFLVPVLLIIAVLSTVFAAAATLATLATERRCEEERTEKYVTYPFMPLIGTNPGIALMPVWQKRKVCKKWEDAHEENSDQRRESNRE
jgi:hypothetical protein